MSAATALYRNRDKVHAAACRYRDDKSTPWNWAEGKSVGEVGSSAINGITFCRVCDPLSILPDRGGHELTDREALDLIALKPSARELVRLRWPDASDDEADFLLWEKTPYPLVSGVHDIVDAVAAIPEAAA